MYKINEYDHIETFDINYKSWSLLMWRELRNLKVVKVVRKINGLVLAP